jgi:CDGSH-type Zn-finger protein/uncharacterized Fe-S cluster protein YjdI
VSDGEKSRFPGKQVDITWDGRLCIHVGECGRARGDLFVAGRNPWCQPDVAAPDEATEVVERCPSGALSYVRADGGVERPDPRNHIVVTNNGPLYARGSLQIDAAPTDAPGLAYRAALCRCGASQNKPFCDNSHERVSFVDRGAIGETGPGCAAATGPLRIQKLADGPLLVEGNFEIIAASGRVAWRGDKAALCRCGASQNKPFCDGSHKRVGFKAE